MTMTRRPDLPLPPAGRATEEQEPPRSAARPASIPAAPPSWGRDDPADPGPHGIARTRRREILDAATALFAVRGYRGTSLREISAQVGISHPGMLHHFHSKDALLDAVIDDLEAHAQHMIDHIETLETSIERTEQAALHNFSARGPYQVLFAVLSTEAIDPEYPGRMRLIRLRRVYEHVAEHVLRSYEARGELAPGLDIGWAARICVSYSLALATREATIGAVQPSSRGLAGPDFRELMAVFTVAEQAG